MLSLPIETLEREHPDHTVRKIMWKRYADLYTGGEVMRLNAQAYLPKRQKEPAEVYYERLSRVFYENYLGSIIDWYAATLLRTEPLVTLGELDQEESFYNLFLDDCDLSGTDFVEFFRAAFISALIYQQSFVLVDFPHVDSPDGFQSRAEEDAAGKSRAYLVNYTPLDIPNYKLDSNGNFEWVVIRTKERFQASFESPDEVERTTWTYFDRTEFRKYQLDSGPGKGTPSGTDVPLVESGPHALSQSNRVPLVPITVSDGLWLANKAALLQLEHFNKSNALAWALHMGLFAMPVIYSERDCHQVVGESYYIQLGPQDRFGWTEPEGKVYAIAQDNLDRLKDEIYRICYLMVQAAGNGAANVTQSAASKQRDYSITQEVLRAYGDMLKDAMKNTLRIVAAARQDEIGVDVMGLDQFDIGELSGELQDAQQLLLLVPNSPTFRKELQKRLALKALDDSEPALKNQIVREIEQA
jgi:uncharacterized membrane protein